MSDDPHRDFHDALRRNLAQQCSRMLLDAAARPTVPPRRRHGWWWAWWPCLVSLAVAALVGSGIGAAADVLEMPVLVATIPLVGMLIGGAGMNWSLARSYRR